MYRITETAEELARELDEIGMGVLTNYTLADAIREGSKVTKQAQGWGDGLETACALTAAFTAAKARNFLI